MHVSGCACMQGHGHGWSRVGKDVDEVCEKAEGAVGMMSKENDKVGVEVGQDASEPCVKPRREDEVHVMWVKRQAILQIGADIRLQSPVDLMNDTSPFNLLPDFSMWNSQRPICLLPSTLKWYFKRSSTVYTYHQPL